MNKLIFVIVIGLALSSCHSHKNTDTCYHGKVIMSSCCSGSTFVELDLAFPIGKATKLNGVDYKNVIQIPGYLTGEDIYLNLRTYDQQKDGSLVPGPYCYCAVTIGMDVPIWVQTQYSNISCPL